MNLNVLDFILLAIVLIFSVRGSVRGLINEVFGIGTFIFSLLLSFAYYRLLARNFDETMNKTLALILAFFVIFIAAFVSIKLIQFAVKALFSMPILKSLDKALGLMLGFVEGAALVVLLLVLMEQLNPTIGSEKLRKESAVSNFVEKTVAFYGKGRKNGKGR